MNIWPSNTPNPSAATLERYLQYLSALARASQYAHLFVRISPIKTCRLSDSTLNPIYRLGGMATPTPCAPKEALRKLSRLWLIGLTETSETSAESSGGFWRRCLT